MQMFTHSHGFEPQRDQYLLRAMPGGQEKLTPKRTHANRHSFIEIYNLTNSGKNTIYSYIPMCFIFILV